MLLVSQQSLSAQSDLMQVAESFASDQVAVDGHSYPYRLLEPLPTQRDRDRPLVVFLHGAGERGADNIQQLKWLPELLAGPARRKKYPCFVLAVQCPLGEQWVDVPWHETKPRALSKSPSRAMRALQRALLKVLAQPGIDTARIYLTGMSMGGYGTWDLMARDGRRFAAAVPVCGGGDSATVPAMFDLPVQVWHGDIDTVVPAVRSRLMVEKYRQMGVPVRYFEQRDVGHDVWRQAYQDEHVFEWMFAQDQRQQRRGAWSEVAIIPAPRSVVRKSGSFTLRAGCRCVVPDELRGLCSYFLDALAVAAVRRPGLVSDVAPASGDIELCIDTELPGSYQVDIGEYVRVTARNVEGMRAGLAAFYQALRTLPGGGAPWGTYSHRGDLPAARLVVAKPYGQWQPDTIRVLLRECWLSSVQTIAFEGGGEVQATAGAYREFLVHARRLGIAVEGVSTTLTQVPAAATSGESIAEVLARPGGGSQLTIVLKAARPDEIGDGGAVPIACCTRMRVPRQTPGASRQLPAAVGRALAKIASLVVGRYDGGTGRTLRPDGSIGNDTNEVRVLGNVAPSSSYIWGAWTAAPTPKTNLSNWHCEGVTRLPSDRCSRSTARGLSAWCSSGWTLVWLGASIPRMFCRRRSSRPRSGCKPIGTMRSRSWFGSG